MKRRIPIVLVVALIPMFASLAQADQGLPSAATLADIGLAGIDVISDREALAIRDQGITVIKTSHSKVVKFNFSYAKPNGKVSAKGFVWAYAR
jgi:hypothetical protein